MSDVTVEVKKAHFCPHSRKRVYPKSIIVIPEGVALRRASRGIVKIRERVMETPILEGRLAVNLEVSPPESLSSVTEGPDEAKMKKGKTGDVAARRKKTTESTS